MTWPRKGTKSQKVFCLCAANKTRSFIFGKILSRGKCRQLFDIGLAGRQQRGNNSAAFIAHHLPGFPILFGARHGARREISPLNLPLRFVVLRLEAKGEILRVWRRPVMLSAMHVHKDREKKFWLFAAVILASAVLASAQTTQRTLLPGHLPAAAATQQPLGRLDGSARLKLSIHLPLRNQEALTSFIEKLYDPESPAYHHYLEPEEFDARFGPTEEDYQAFAWAAASGFAVTARHPNRMLLEVSASVGDIERALQVTMRTYAHPAESRAFFSPDAEPSVEKGVPILYMGGLDNFALAASEKSAALPIEDFRESRAANGWLGPKRKSGRLRFSGGLCAGRHADGDWPEGRVGRVRRLFRRGHRLV